jgi:hypothetical protein
VAIRSWADAVAIERATQAALRNPSMLLTGALRELVQLALLALLVLVVQLVLVLVLVLVLALVLVLVWCGCCRDAHLGERGFGKSLALDPALLQVTAKCAGRAGAS